MSYTFIIFSDCSIKTKEEHMEEINNNPDSWREQD